MLSASSLASKLSDARAALPHRQSSLATFRPSLPSLVHLRSKLPTVRNHPSSNSFPEAVDSGSGSADRAASLRLATVESLDRLRRSIQSKVARLRPAASSNQCDAEREESLAAALAWIESLEAREAACAYALAGNCQHHCNFQWCCTRR